MTFPILMRVPPNLLVNRFIAREGLALSHRGCWPSPEEDGTVTTIFGVNNLDHASAFRAQSVERRPNLFGWFVSVFKVTSEPLSPRSGVRYRPVCNSLTGHARSIQAWERGRP
jgi:hypothetical protein